MHRIVMHVIVFGATGTIGAAVADHLEAQGHTVSRVGRTSGDHRADITDATSVERLYDELAPFGAVVCAAGEAAFGTLDDLDDADFDLGLSSKLMGQVNLVRKGLPYLRAEGGSFTLVSGVLSQEPIPGSAAISMVNAGVEAFGRAAALEAPERVRVNTVSPPWVAETLDAMGRDPSDGMPAEEVARAFAESVEGTMSGEVLDAHSYA